ncbi:hypothetical protein GA0115246_1031722 [Streptomyces sp. SolWspMP-sol7th]|nr:hypothetical protein GA0115246_1031722 [Streptomyces sp. SolWspMP-sol7th]
MAPSSTLTRSPAGSARPETGASVNRGASSSAFAAGSSLSWTIPSRVTVCVPAKTYRSAPS